MLAALGDPDHPDHEERSDWMEEDFDSNAFDLKRANTVLDAKFNTK